ncbi:hypothetical protein [Novosphingobium sp. BL-52-GroH]|uniref:hypothetical protein n=1 Tax=Novosphingobium sp. BL-52-GroH TaxID=3349877 RepID=UPI00384E70EB
MNRPSLTLAAIALSVSMPALAYAGEPVVQAVQLGNESIRYDKGVPTLDLVQSRGAVQIVPLGKDHGSYVFEVVVINAGDVPANFDITNVSVQVGSQPVGIFNVDELMSKAKSRNTWSQLGVAFLGSLGSAAAASQRDVYRSSYHSRWGSSYATFSAPSVAGQIQSARLQDQTTDALMQMRAQLDDTRAKLGNEIVQMTTVAPRDSYAGKIILAKLKSSSLPQPVNITVNWNGEDYRFAFQIAKSGTPAPAFTPMPFQPLPQRQKPTPAVLQESPQSVVPPQIVQASARRPARDVIASAVQPTATSSYVAPPKPDPVQVTYTAPAPRMLPGGLVEVPMKAAPWASKIDPWTGNVVPADPASIGGLVAVAN